MFNTKGKIIFLIVIVLLSWIIFTYYAFHCSYAKKNSDKISEDKILVNRNFWNKIRKDIRGRGKPNKILTDKEKKALAKLQTLGYLSGYQKKPDREGVTLYRKDKAYNGYNFYVSGCNPSAAFSKQVFLIDMEGKVLHRWHPLLDKELMDTNWRRAYLYKNGDILVIVENSVLIKADKDSNIIWIYRGWAHHDLFVDGNGYIYILKIKPRIVPRYNPKKPIYDDLVCVLGPSGQERKCVSVLNCLENSSYSSLLDRVKGKHGDILHTNTIEVLDGRFAYKDQAFKKGNVLISIRNLNTVCIVDLDSESVVWALSDLWKYQHQPTILENGNMLVFDNNPTLEDIRAIDNFKYFLKDYNSLPDSVGESAFSRVIEVDPFSKKIVWEFRGNKAFPFYSFVLGSAQRLPNGNTLITESVAGRAFEVTREKEIVWEFINPHTAGDNNKLIATLNEVVRLPPDFPLDWCKSCNK